MTDAELRTRMGPEIYDRMTDEDRTYTRSNYFDYAKQARVKDGRYIDCGHPAPGEVLSVDFAFSDPQYPGEIFHGCACYGRTHAGEIATGAGVNGA